MPPRPARGHLSQLPVEILVSIFQQCPEFSTLWSLLNTSSLLRGIFNNWALDIVNSVLKLTVPVQTRALIQTVTALHTDSFSCTSYAEANRCGFADYRHLDPLVASPEQLRRLVRLSHQIHILAHLCIEDCIQNCLVSPLGQPFFTYPQDFGNPTWTEEHRAILSFWRALYFSELKRAKRAGQLKNWTIDDFLSVDAWGLKTHLGYGSRGYQALTACWFMWKLANPGCPEEEFWNAGVMREPLKLPVLPEGSEYGWWTCQPPPCSEAVGQGWDVSRLDSYSPAPRRADTDSSSGDTNTSVESSRFVYSDQSSSEDSESQNSISNSDDGSTPQPAPPCPVVNRARPEIIPLTTSLDWAVLPYSTQNFGQHSPVQEYLNLNAETLSVQFWLRMRRMHWALCVDNVAGMYFEAYIKYGFALWEECRMVKLGLWSSEEGRRNPGKYIWRWYEFLSDEEILLFNDRYQDGDSVTGWRPRIRWRPPRSYSICTTPDPHDE